MKLTDKTTIYIPTHLVPSMTARIDNITSLAGGATYENAKGKWYDDDGYLVSDDITKVSWWSEGSLPVQELTGLIDKLLEEEHTVMVESTINGNEHYATLHTKE